MFTSDKDLRKPLSKAQRRPRPSGNSFKQPHGHGASSTAGTTSAAPSATLSSGDGNNKNSNGSSSNSFNTSSSKSSEKCDAISGAKHPTPSTSGGREGAEDVLQRAKRERAVREAERTQRRYVVVLQAWYRGRRTARCWRAEQRSEFDKKLRDLQTVAGMLRDTRGVTLVPPLAVSAGLLRALLAPPLLPADYPRLLLLCESVLTVSLADMDPSKNLIALLAAAPLLLSRLFAALVQVLCGSTSSASATASRSDAYTAVEKGRAAVVPVLALLLGLDTPFRLRPPEPIRAGFIASRRLLLLPASAACHAGLFKVMARALFQLATQDGLLDPETDETTPSRAKLNNTGASAELATALVELGLRVVLLAEEAEEVGQRDVRGSEFARQLLGAPLATSLLSRDCLARLAAPQALALLLDVFASRGDDVAEVGSVLPPSPHAVFGAGHWALGNLAALFPMLPLVPMAVVTDSKSAEKSSTAYQLVSDAMLVRYMDVLGALLAAHPVPGVLQGRSGVLWHRVGAVLSASGVPRGLQRQVQGVLDAPTCRSLYSRILRPLPLPVTLCAPSHSKKASSKASARYDTVPPSSKEDAKDIAAALSSSGVKLAQRDMKDRQAERAESSSFFGLGAGSVWAKKLTKSLGGMLFGGGGSEQASNEALQAQIMQQQQQASSSEGSAASESKALLDNEPASPFPLNVLAVQSLCRLWSLLLPAAATGAPPESSPWRALSGLCFSTRVVGRLWGYALNASSAASSSFASTSSSASSSDFQLDKDLSVAPTKTTGVGAAVSAVAVLVAVLKVQLMALDDSELYDQELPVPLPYLLPLVRCLNLMVFTSIQEDPAMLLEVSLPASVEGRGGGGASKGDDVAGTRRALQMDVLRCAVAVLADLHTRWARRPFASPSLWEVTSATASSALRADLRRVLLLGLSRGGGEQALTPSLQQARAVLRLLPWALPFYDRVTLFREVVAAERQAIQGSDDVNAGDRSRGTVVKVRRQRLLADGIAALERVGGAIKDRVVVRYVNDFGEDESGIDVGGLFKDFLTDLSERVFDPHFGLFCLTPAQLLYPHPSAAALMGCDPARPQEMQDTFAFIGRVLGKALFEDITIQPQFAHFFLAFMMGKCV